MTELETRVRTLYRELTETLIKKNKKITTMESATSGQIASLITDTEGSSAVSLERRLSYQRGSGRTAFHSAGRGGAEK